METSHCQIKSYHVRCIDSKKNS